MKLFNEEFGKEQIRQRFDNLDVIADARESVVVNGKSCGVKTIDVATGSGLHFTVVPSRGMDIAFADFQGAPLAYVSKTGIVHPSYFEKDGLNFMRSFFCGLMTTRGLTYMGAPCNDEGVELGLHGRINHTPAENYKIEKKWVDNDYVIQIEGKVRESCVFGENVTLTRQITTKMGSNSLKVHDVIENEGFKEQPLMILYHCNFGFPIVSPDSRISISEPYKVEARDAYGDVDRCHTFEDPQTGYAEQVFLYSVDRNSKDCTVCVHNNRLKIGVRLTYHPEQLPYLSEWKVMDCDEYVMGIEPSNWTVYGRSEARKRKELTFLQPGEKKEIDLEFSVIDERS